MQTYPNRKTCPNRGVCNSCNLNFGRPHHSLLFSSIAQLHSSLISCFCSSSWSRLGEYSALSCPAPPQASHGVAAAAPCPRLPARRTLGAPSCSSGSVHSKASTAAARAATIAVLPSRAPAFTVGPEGPGGSVNPVVPGPTGAPKTLLSTAQLQFAPAEHEDIENTQLPAVASPGTSPASPQR